MRLARRIAGSVHMMVVLVMTVGMLMPEFRMEMAVLVLLGDMQPDTHAHQAGSGEQLDGERLTERHDSGGSAEEGRSREIGAGARRAEMAQRQYEQRQAETISQQA